MAFSLFRKDTSSAAQRERADRLEQGVADGLRRLSQLFTRAAELIESRRLERNGYVKPEKFLERADRPGP